MIFILNYFRRENIFPACKRNRCGEILNFILVSRYFLCRFFCTWFNRVFFIIAFLYCCNRVIEIDGISRVFWLLSRWLAVMWHDFVTVMQYRRWYLSRRT